MKIIRNLSWDSEKEEIKKPEYLEKVKQTLDFKDPLKISDIYIEKESTGSKENVTINTIDQSLNRMTKYIFNREEE